MAAKSPDAFRTISEVADWLDRPAHVLRFWESKFPQVKPVKRAGGRRYYRPDDMLLLGGIKKLLHDDGMTIKGVQKIMREQGVKYVSGMSQPLDEATAASQGDSDAVDAVIATSAPASGLQLVPGAPRAPDDAPAAPMPAAAAPAQRADDTAVPMPVPAAQMPPAPAEPPAAEPAPQQDPVMPARAPLGADLPPPPDTDAIRGEPGLLARLAARHHPIPARDREALMPILARIDALSTRLAAARKG
ncbi:MAG: MerR family transcriptional regulator [Rhodobacterales bacterium]|nr:MerR family transcriptional regulator [Rhodobacterales bacterium]MDX5391973.1 MerR family transcriptional regulator [Rhodobacterales bacterium]MDX5491664.1 MerR family transcriptional regulator [Rhodobacterales bacterium]